MKDKEEAIEHRYNQIKEGYEQFTDDVNKRVNATQYNSYLIELISRLAYVHTAIETRNELFNHDGRLRDSLLSFVEAIDQAKPERPADIGKEVRRLELTSRNGDKEVLLALPGVPRLLEALNEWLKALPEHFDEIRLTQDQRVSAEETIFLLNRWLAQVAR